MYTDIRNVCIYSSIQSNSSVYEHYDNDCRTLSYYCTFIYVLMRDEKEGRKKQARSNKQQGKATQHTQYMYICICSEILWKKLIPVSQILSTVY